MKTATATVENSMEFPQKTKSVTAFWLRDSSGGNIPWEYRITNSKKLMHPYVYSSAIYNSQVLEIAEVPTSKWVDQKTVVHLHSGIPHRRKKEEGIVTAWMEVENIILSE